MDWHYLSDHQERIPVPEERLRALALGGVLRPTTLLWRRGNSGWQSCGELRPELFAPATPAELALPAEDTRSPAAQLALQRIGQGIRPYLPWIGAFGWVLFIFSLLHLIPVLVLAGYLTFSLASLKLRFIDAGLPENLAENIAPVAGTLALAAGIAILGMWLGWRLIGARRQFIRSWIHGSVEEFQRALSRVGTFFVFSTLILLIITILGLGSVVWQNWPEEKKATEPKETPKVEAAPKPRTTI